MYRKAFQNQQDQSLIDIDQSSRNKRFLAFEEEENQRILAEHALGDGTDLLEQEMVDMENEPEYIPELTTSFDLEENKDQTMGLLRRRKDEEIDPLLQAKLEQEFAIYAEHKLQLIDRGIDLIPNIKRRPPTKEEKKEAFIKKRDKFLKRMQRSEHNFWGTDKYDRLLEKWFPDYTLVLENKVSEIKIEIDGSIAMLNKKISEVVQLLQTTLISVAEGNIRKALELIALVENELVKARKSKDNAVLTLTGFPESETGDFLPQYDTILDLYRELITTLQANIGGNESDTARFETTLTHLSQQKELLAAFNHKVQQSSDVLELVRLQDTELTALITSTEKMIDEANKAEPITGAPDEASVQTQLGSGKATMANLNKELVSITGGVSSVYWGKGRYYNEEVDALYIVATDYSAAYHYTLKGKFDGFWFFVDSKSGWISTMQQRDSVTKYYLMNPVTSTEISHLFIYIKKNKLSFPYDLSSLLDLGLDSKEFRILIEKVQDSLFGSQFRSKNIGYGLYTPQTKKKLQDSIADELKKQEKEQIDEIFGPDYEKLPGAGKETQNIIKKLSSPDALKVYKLKEQYRDEYDSDAYDEELADKLKKKYETAAIQKFGSVKNFEDLINKIEEVFQARALQIANNILNNTEKLINFELKGYQDESKLKDLGVKLNPAKANYETYLYERWEADRWANVSEMNESDPYKGMLNANDYNAMSFAFSAETEAGKVAEQGHPMMSYYTQPSNRNKFGILLGINGYTPPGAPDLNLDLTINLDKTKPAPKKAPRDPYKNPYKNYGFGFNSVRNQQQSSEPVNSLSAIHAQLKGVGTEIKQGIHDTRANLKDKPHKVWDLDNVIEITSKDLKLTQGTLASKLINDRIKKAQDAKFFKDLFLTILNIGLGILAASGIGAPLAILCGLASVGISAYQLKTHYDEKTFLNSAAKTGFTPQTALSSVEPDNMWMVLDLIGLGLDVIAAVKIVGQLGKMPSFFKAGGKGGDILYRPQLLEQFEKEVHSVIKNTDEANEIIAGFTKRLDNPTHVEAIRNTDFSKTHLKNADEITETSKVKPKENGRLEDDSLDTLKEVEKSFSDWLSKLKGAEYADLRKHIFEGEISGGKFTGCHYRKAVDGVNIRFANNAIPESNSLGVLKGDIEFRREIFKPGKIPFDPPNYKWTLKNTNGEPQTFFPSTWSQDEILEQCASALANPKKALVPGKTRMYTAESNSGVFIKWFEDNGKITSIFPEFY